MFFSRQTSIVGVDIGTSDIKIAQITHGSSDMALDTYGIVNFSYSLSGQNAESLTNSVAEVLTELFRRSGVTTKKAVISLPGSAVFTSIIELPTMTEKELRQSLEFEAKKYIPLPVSDVVLSWAVVEEKSQQHTMSVLLTAVPKHVRSMYEQLFARLDLDVRAIDIEAMALVRSLLPDAHGHCVIIDIGAKSTAINVVEGKYLQLSRSLNIGGETITARIAEALGITPGRAEQFKRDFGLSNATLIPDAIRPVLSAVRDEVRQILTIYQVKNIPIERIMLVGGSSNLPGLDKYFGELGVTVEFGDPLKHLRIPPQLAQHLKTFSRHLPVAIGLAMRSE